MYQVYMKGAYYVPQQPLNIISTRAIMSLGGAAVFDARDSPQYVRWSTVDGDIYQAMMWQRELPFIQCSVHVVSVNAMRRAIPRHLVHDVTHAAFGHMSPGKLQRLAAEGYIDASKARHDDTHACAACTEANASLESYHSVHDLAATHVNHTLHTDLLHFPVPTVDGKQYLMLVIDEFSRYVFPALLVKKSEAGAHLLRIMKRAYVLHTVRVKNLRSDNGGEFRNTVMNIAQNELGIAHEYVPPNCHQSNGLIERLNRTIASVMRAVLTQAHIPPALWGEAALYAVHIYNLTPHSALLDRKESSAVPHSLYMKDSPERMTRLYHQLVPFGILCNIVQTGDKPKQVKKLDSRSVPGIIVGMGPSTQQYRVMVLRDSAPYRVHIVRHIVLNAAHYTEYFASDAVLPILKQYQSVNCVSVLNFEQGISLTSAHVHNSQEVLCCSLLPAQALSRGSESVDECADEIELPQVQNEPDSKRVREETHEPDEDDQVTAAQERERLEEAQRFEWAKYQTVKQIEPLPDTISISDYLEIERLRLEWLRKVAAVQVSINHGCIHISMCKASDDTPCAGYVLTDCGDDAGKTTTESEVLRQLWQLQDICIWQCDIDNPSLSQAMNGPHREKWLEAIQSEISSLNEMKTFELVKRPSNRNVIRGHFVLKIKRESNGEIERFKARYVVQGNHQREGIDYSASKLWAPTGQHTTLRVLMVHAATRNLCIRHIDISTAFLHGELDEEVYVEQPPIINDGTNKVWRLTHALYGLRQSPAKWHEKLCEQLKLLGFSRAGYDPALMVKRLDSGELCFMFLWVDDLIIVGTQHQCDQVVREVLGTFKGRDLGEASWLLGMSVKRDMSAKTIELSQEQMIGNVLQRYGIEKSSTLPMDPNTEATPDPHDKARRRVEREISVTDDRTVLERLHVKLAMFESDCEPLPTDEHARYMAIIGAVQYIAVVTRPDIAFAASALARYMSCPTKHLMNCAMKLLRYLAATRTHVLRYDCSKVSDNAVTGYSDADFAGCSKTSKSTSGLVILFCGQPVHWRSKRQPIVTSSTTEAELVALNLCALQVQWLKLMLGDDLGVDPLKAQLYCDNKSTVTVSRNPISSDRSRHIAVKYRKIQELIEKQVMSVVWIPTKEQLADILTKPLPRVQFEVLRDKLRVLPALK